MPLPRLVCQRCGHSWIPRKEVLPKTCPNKKCNSPYWNKPRSHSMTTTLETAIIYAIKAHRGKKDLQGLPYVLHPIAVMLQMDTDEERILALCHDISEDTNMTAEMVANALNMSDEWATWLDALTHKKNMPYEDYIEGIKPYPVAVRVKIADMKHNLSRLDGLEDKDRRKVKYEKGLKLIIAD